MGRLTLIVLVVLAVVGALVLAKIFGHTDHTNRDAKVLEMQLSHLASAVAQYKLDTGAFPLNLAVLAQPAADGNGPYAKPTSLIDPWRVPLYYRVGPDGFLLFSLGKDGQVGGRGLNADQQAVVPPSGD